MPIVTRKLLAAAIAALILVPTASAGTTWYWDTTRAETRLAKNGAVVEVYGCRPYGKGIKREGEPAMWRNFTCDVLLKSGKTAGADMRVTGKNLYRVWMASPDPATS